ncbi:hypothetical protein [Adonisia turfae]|uniref:hypothetical protein n=1 Tax=Adonisia turfae TaxID=2950184 RepID=UPI0013D30D71|nr:hypothetical protein [Adonisia turfae]
MVYLLSKPEDWVTRLDDIVKHSSDGRASVLSGLKELKQKGYLEKVRITDQKTGQVSHWETIVHEQPIATSPDVENRHSGNPDSGNPHSGKSNPTKYGSIQNTDQEITSFTHTQNTEQSANAQGVCGHEEESSFSDLTRGEENSSSELPTSGQSDQKPALKPAAASSKKSNNEIYGFVKWANKGFWSLKVTKTLERVAENKTWDDLKKALQAMCEQYESEEGLKHQQRYFIKAVSEGWEASQEWHERKGRELQQKAESERREKEAERVKVALKQMEVNGDIELIDHKGQWYDYRLPGDVIVYNANAWDLPKGFSWREDAA